LDKGKRSSRSHRCHLAQSQGGADREAVTLRRLLDCIRFEHTSLEPLKYLFVSTKRCNRVHTYPRTRCWVDVVKVATEAEASATSDGKEETV
ncbi:unnamed protein product, partial [Ectocarpus sp. 12 AP-2014]